MADLPPAGYAFATLHWTIGGGSDDFLNILCVQNSDENDAVDVALGVSTAAVAALLPVMPTGITLANVRAVTSDGSYWDQDTNEPGVVAAEMAPPNVTYLIRKVTGRVGRNMIGRIYLPGVQEAKVNNFGNLADDLFDDMAAAADEFLSNLQDESVALFLRHPSGGSPTLVVDLDCERKVATQRRRLR